MKFEDMTAETFPVSFTGDNTYICDLGETFLPVAKKALGKLGAASKTVYITDKYLFPTNHSQYPDYENELLELLRYIGAKEYVLCAKEKKNAAMYSRIEAQLSGYGIKLSFNDQLEITHNRYWYCKETNKCVVFGTSLNGIGVEVSDVNLCSASDTNYLKRTLFRNV